MARKRLLWKTISLTSHDDYRRVRSAWGSSSQAFGKNKVMNFDGVSSLETNIPLSGLKTLFSHAGVEINWSQDVLWDSKPLTDDDDS